MVVSISERVKIERLMQRRPFAVFTMSKSRKSNRLDGCTFTLFVGVLMVGLYVANGVLVRMIFPGSTLDPRVSQPIQFGLPIILIFFEYWIYDRLTRRFSRD